MRHCEGIFAKHVVHWQSLNKNWWPICDHQTKWERIDKTIHAQRATLIYIYIHTLYIYHTANMCKNKSEQFSFNLSCLSVHAYVCISTMKREQLFTSLLIEWCWPYFFPPNKQANRSHVFSRPMIVCVHLRLSISFSVCLYCSLFMCIRLHMPPNNYWNVNLFALSNEPKTSNWICIIAYTTVWIHLVGLLICYAMAGCYNSKYNFISFIYGH